MSDRLTADVVYTEAVRDIIFPDGRKQACIAIIKAYALQCCKEHEGKAEIKTTYHPKDDHWEDTIIFTEIETP